jgi:hypothetical protein
MTKEFKNKSDVLKENELFPDKGIHSYEFKSNSGRIEYLFNNGTQLPIGSKLEDMFARIDNLVSVEVEE